MAKDILFQFDDDAFSGKAIKSFSIGDDIPSAPSDTSTLGTPRRIGTMMFEDTFDSLFGKGKTYGAVDEPYSKRFEFIFINGQSVANLCADKIKDMNEKDANDYMKFAVVNALYLKSEKPSIVEVCSPQMEKGKPTGVLSEPTLVRPQELLEPTKKKTGAAGFFQRIGQGINSLLENIGWREPTDKNKIYDKWLQNNNSSEDKKKRHEKINAQLDESQAKTEKKRISQKVNRDSNERDKLQTKLYENAKGVIGKESVDNDMEAFFGNTPASAFAPKSICGVDTLDGKDGHGRCGRLSMVRLYMYSKGFSPEQIFSQEPGMMEIKKQIGKEYTDIMTTDSPDRPKKIGMMYGKISKAIMDTPVPNIDFRDNRALAGDFYKQFALFDCVMDHSQSFFNSGVNPEAKKAFDEMISPDKEKYKSAESAVLGMTYALRTKYQQLFGTEYSSANNDKRDSYNVPVDRKISQDPLTDTWGMEVYTNNKLLDEVNVKTKGVTSFDKADIDTIKLQGRYIEHTAGYLQLSQSDKDKLHLNSLVLNPQKGVQEDFGGFDGLKKINEVPEVFKVPTVDVSPSNSKSMVMGGDH